MRQAQLVGRTGKPDLQHERVYAAVQGIGGWYELCSSENSGADRAAFMKAYEAGTKRAQDAVILAAVPELAAPELLALASGAGQS